MPAEGAPHTACVVGITRILLISLQVDMHADGCIQGLPSACVAGLVRRLKGDLVDAVGDGNAYAVVFHEPCHVFATTPACQQARIDGE